MNSTAALLAIALSALSQSAFSAVEASYQFDGDALDSSGNGRNGTIIGATLTEDRFGNRESALLFDGVDDRVIVPIIFSGDQDPISITAWVRPDAPNKNHSIYGEFYGDPGRGDTRNYFLLGTNTDGGTLNFDQYFPAGGEATVDIGWRQATGQWINVAMVKNQNLVTFYVNGIARGTVSHYETYSGYSPKVAAIGSRRIFGNWTTYNSLYSFQGAIDDVRIYSNALSDVEVQQIASVPEPTGFAMLIGGLLTIWGTLRHSKRSGTPKAKSYCEG